MNPLRPKRDGSAEYRFVPPSESLHAPRAPLSLQEKDQKETEEPAGQDARAHTRTNRKRLKSHPFLVRWRDQENCFQPSTVATAGLTPARGKFLLSVPSGGTSLSLNCDDGAPRVAC